MMGVSKSPVLNKS
jgi:hypothetical protein